MVECQLPKLKVAGSTPVSRSILRRCCQHVAVLIHRAPEILALPVDRDEELVQGPRIAESTLSSLQAPCVVGTELPAPVPHGLVRPDDTSFRQQVLDIPEAQAVSVESHTA